MRIAILEDDPLHSELLKRWLTRSAPNQVLCFRTFTELMSFCEQASHIPCVIILDAYLDGKMSDGLIKDIRKSAKNFRDFGIVLTSSLPEKLNLEIASTWDIDAFLDKDQATAVALEISVTLAHRAAKLRSERSDALNRRDQR